MKILFVLLGLAAIGLPALAQSSMTVTGQVSDALSGAGLPGATVTVQDRTGTGTLTDGDGRFRLSVPAGKQTLRISYLGYSAQRVVVGNGDGVVHQKSAR